MKKIISIALGVVVVAAIIGYTILTSGMLEISMEELQTKYKLPNSEFMDIDGVQIHYVDEGEGPAVVMLHASFHSLRSWDSMAESLKKTFRVIRFDFPIAGLSGFVPGQSYSMDYDLELVNQLTRALGVKEFSIIATSSGGTVGFRYTATHPDQITRLVLINSAGMPRTRVTNPNRARGSAIRRWIQSHYKSRAYWEGTLSNSFTSMVPPEDLVQMVYDMNRRQGLNEAAMMKRRNYRTGEPESMLQGVEAPTMIAWGMENPIVMHLEANIFSLWITNAPTLVKKYPNVGHYLYLEIPDTVESDVLSFLSGDLDNQLRQTMRLPARLLTAADGVKKNTSSP